MSISSPIARDSAARISASFLDFSERTNECGKPLAKDQTFWDAELDERRREAKGMAAPFGWRSIATSSVSI